MSNNHISEKYCLYDLLHGIAEANEDEQEAIKKYSKLLKIIHETVVYDIEHEELLCKLKDDIEEYIAEELKHSIGLNECYSALSGIIAED